MSVQSCRLRAGRSWSCFGADLACLCPVHLSCWGRLNLHLFHPGVSPSPADPTDASLNPTFWGKKKKEENVLKRSKKVLWLHVIATHADAVFLVFFSVTLLLFFFLWWLCCFFIRIGCVLLGYLTSVPDLSEMRRVKSPGEACLVSSCNLYWKTVYLSLVHTEF